MLGQPGQAALDQCTPLAPREVGGAFLSRSERVHKCNAMTAVAVESADDDSSPTQ